MGHYVPQNPIDLIMEKASRTPGPADYCPGKKELAGGTFSSSFPPRELDIIEREASRIPGPMHYSLPSFSSSIPGGKFNLSKPKTALEEYIYSKEYIPGPGTYNYSALRNDSGAAFYSNVDRTSSTALGNAKEVSPGPGYYNTERGENYVNPVRVTTFPNFSPPTSLERVIKKTRELPGPDTYDSLTPIKSGKISKGLASWKAPVF